MDDRYTVNEKQDANSPVLRTNDFLSNSYPLDLNVVFSTSGIDPQSAGIVYSISYDPSYYLPEDMPEGWQEAYAHHVGTNENGRNVFSVTTRLQSSYSHNPGFVRYAIFAVDRHSGETYWDNNDGGDFFVFFNKSRSPLVDFEYQKDADSLTLELYTTNLGQEEVVLVYSLDEWETTQELAAEWIDGANIDHWQATVTLDSQAEEMVFALAIKFDDSTLWANNFGHNYHVGLVDPDPAEILFNQDGIEVLGTLQPGGFFKVVYNREALCLTCYQGVCTKSIQLQYRLYQDVAFWKHQLHREFDNDYCGEIECPEVMASDPIYIPLDADNLSMWFLHTGGRPPCSDWDSNQGNDYYFELE
jgi:hypothetical protein